MTDSLLIEKRDRVTLLTLNAPEKRNAISTDMRRELLAAVEACLADTNCGAMVLTGAGGHFCSGGDISEMKSPAALSQGGGSRLEILHDVVRRIVFGGKPVIAAVEGSAAGAGMSLAAVCDYVVTASDARFIAAFTRVGLIADCGLLWSLPRRVGPSRAAGILMSARTVHAVEAHRIGLADEITEPGTAVSRALGKAGELLAVAPLALQATRQVLTGGADELEAILAKELALQGELRMTRDHEEGKRAFRERRAPIFIGR